MKIKEVIDTIVELCGLKTYKQLEKHLDYLIRSGQLSEFKEGGTVICTQNTTIKHSYIRVEQQLQWYIVVQFIWDEFTRLKLPAEEYQSAKQHFILKLYETGVMGSEGMEKLI